MGSTRRKKRRQNKSRRRGQKCKTIGGKLMSVSDTANYFTNLLSKQSSLTPRQVHDAAMLFHPQICSTSTKNAFIQQVERLLSTHINPNTAKSILSYYLNHKYTADAPMLRAYCDILAGFAKDEYCMYSLGDSLYKFVQFWNILHYNNSNAQVTHVPFSGCMYTTNLKLNDETMNQKFAILLEHNIPFQNLVTDLNVGNPVMITDYINNGRGFLTLLHMLFNHNISTQTLYFYFVTYNDDITSESLLHLATQFHYTNRPIVLNVPDDRILDRYFTNSEDTQSRCVPRYTVTDWNTPVSSIQTINYALCNLHTLLFYIAHFCDFQQYVHLNKRRAPK